MTYQATAPDGRTALTPTPARVPPIISLAPNVRKATGGHGGWKVDAPQSITGLRSQMEAAKPGTAMDCRGLLFHYRGEQLTIHDNVTEILGGVFVIEPTATARAGILPRDRVNPLRFVGSTFCLLGTTTQHMEALVYAYACRAEVIFEGCVFAGEPKDTTRAMSGNPGDFNAPAGRSRCLSVKSSTAVQSGGVVIDRCSFLAPDERGQPTGGVGIPAIDVAGALGHPQRDWYLAYKTPTTVLMPAGKVAMTSSTVQGGYYGLALASAPGFRVEGNSFTGNMRGVSAQDSCRDGLIKGNLITEFKSSGIHTAYGTRTVDVVGNMLSSTVAEGQGVLQAYCGTYDIAFIGNTVALAAGTSAQAHVYVGNDAQSTEIRGNLLNGPYRDASVSVDQSWTKANGIEPGYSKRYTPDEPLGVSVDLLGTEVVGNRSTGPLTLRATASTGRLTLLTDTMPAVLNGQAREISGLTVI